jgi:hypothetical protein
MGEADLIDRALAYAPWVAPVLAGVILLRKELAAFLSANKNDAVMEGLTGQMVSLFTKNLEYFAKVEAGMTQCATNTAQTSKHLEELTNVQRSILTEIVRDSQRKGG